MKVLKAAMAAALAIPLLLSVAPAEALTSNQYAAQGRGHYIPSKGRAPFYRGHRHRPHGFRHRPYRYGYRHHGRPHHYGY